MAHPILRPDTAPGDYLLNSAIDSRDLEGLRQKLEVGADPDGSLDYALAQVDSRFVHLLLAYSSSGLDIRRAYSAVDRLTNPMPFRLMETYKMPPLSQFILAGFLKAADLRAYLESRPLLSQAEAHDAIIQATEVVERDAEGLRWSEQASDHERLERLEAVTAYLRSFAADLMKPWDTGGHDRFPRAFREAVECCVGIAARWPPQRHVLPLALWGHVFSFLDRSALAPPIRLSNGVGESAE